MLSEGREPRCGEEEERVTVTPLDKGCPKPKPSEGNRDPEEGVAGRCYIKERLAVTEPQDETGRRRKEG